jgi:hypothetical protein
MSSLMKSAWPLPGMGVQPPEPGQVCQIVRSVAMPKHSSLLVARSTTTTFVPALNVP